MADSKVQAFENDAIIQTYFEKLKVLISRKSIFAQQIGLLDVATYLKDMFEEAGAEVVLDDSYAAPFVMATFKASVPDAKTLIFYNHYDTVPADADQVWEKGNPFELTISDGYIYGRGVDDDKGHITARLSALKKYQARQNGHLPVNVIFIMEGAEESASVDLDKYLSKYKEHLIGADLLVWEQGHRNSLHQLEIAGGNKGIVTFDLQVKSADLDIHSSYGGVINSASWYLLSALQSMRAADGRILVDGIYEQVQEPNERELALVEEFALATSQSMKDIYGLTLPTLVEDRREFLKRLYFEPSITIEGLSTGYLGQGVKTIIPAQASAKTEVRLVPGLEPYDVLDKIRKHLDKHGFDKIEVIFTLGEMSYRSDMSHPAIVNVIELAKKLTPEGVAVLPTSPGTGPMHTVFHALGVPIAGFGLGNANSRDHAGDENVSIADYYSHVELVEELIASYE
ncbi:TPA: M20/M25/M40 family metallo-hydrolase [Streptococcus suis]|uniref:Acetylornithine deacetylase/succinyl-diaminopimelate desuccinylase-like protein n=1 Tax=Streptococcus suis TaxID=1307 RepID=A0A116MPB3_STRSU|nr:M20/M25/M40 family metallo-hydrolase [Streptococcus suis]NQG74932.1 M20/M25/M40 family metallo-hydrolase [Streptococcus suis]NQG79200.1 M20/M25/M40 family metallo-hydrolase [Streptococcus suis]CYV58686.1 acetylornithine deacetylase/succinyl-diaminopimelate desuccinylase-like protein [Streptococcus suis]CYV59977.1 acetylornithine deacetylase/succinyl-diaminopimelate desuccinylase-like protein [Streptococcus suis]HEM2814002.1 M20/M25/M40 family metallo-hydrolase [Streptococcus suis]